MTMRVFMFGAGYSARAFAQSIRDEAEWIVGTTRSLENATRLEAIGIRPLVFDGRRLNGKARERLRTATHLVVSAGPDESGDPVLDAARAAIAQAMPRLEWIGYLSTVGVYGDHDGAWVDEESECRPVSQRSSARLAAEREWMELAEETDVSLAIARLAGIYGPGRNAFVKLEQGTAQRIVKPGQVFNRIHVDDIAGALALLARGRIDGIFNFSDDAPAPPQDVIAFAADHMGVEPPPETAFEDARMSPMARSFYGERKCVANAKLKAAGYRFRHPDYRAGLASLWQGGNWRGESG